MRVSSTRFTSIINDGKKGRSREKGLKNEERKGLSTTLLLWLGQLGKALLLNKTAREARFLKLHCPESLRLCDVV